jgi:hypothetical protein
LKLVLGKKNNRKRIGFFWLAMGTCQILAHKVYVVFVWFYRPDVTVSKHLWNVDKLLPYSTAQHPRRKSFVLADVRPWTLAFGKSSLSEFMVWQNMNISMIVSLDLFRNAVASQTIFYPGTCRFRVFIKVTWKHAFEMAVCAPNSFSFIRLYIDITRSVLCIRFLYKLYLCARWTLNCNDLTIHEYSCSSFGRNIRCNRRALFTMMPHGNREARWILIVTRGVHAIGLPNMNTPVLWISLVLL